MVDPDYKVQSWLGGLPFVKAQALGNDFVIIQRAHIRQPLTENALAQSAVFLADRHYGVGCDQVIIVEQVMMHKEHTSRGDQAVVNNNTLLQLRFFNRDGSEAESCGNGSRAFALWWMELHQLTTVTFGTKGGLVTAAKGLEPHSIELYLPMPMVDLTISVDDFSDQLSAAPVFVNTGNPHLILYVDRIVDVEMIGAYMEKHPLFLHGVNVSFVHMDHSDCENNQLSISVWERGVGRTKACGTGAIASAIATAERGFLEKERLITVNQEGGLLTVLYGTDNIILVGKAYIVFDGKITLP